ncbi:MAG: adenylosuccinate synthase [Bacteroidetes bacterium]|nr:adenylosuccinate synthase [Bacteroidota bacterium]MBK8144804.1 adenylosuccinate synthase [Bacteroidota bacterium]
MVDVLLGLQWGDEGKGKIVDFLAPEYDIIARFQGGPNAGHTLYLNDKKVVLHTIPSGVFHPKLLNVIGNGVVIDPVSFKAECEEIEGLGVQLASTLIISEKAHIILPTHKALDKANELAKGSNKIGSTLKGIGPTYMDKTGRNGLRVGDLLQSDFTERYNTLKDKHLSLLKQMHYEEDISHLEADFFAAVEALKKYKILAVDYWLNEQISQGKKVLAEGAQGTMLDIDFGTYPFVTSSNTITAGLCTGLGIAPKWVGKVFGISKAYCTRVGSGPFPTELLDETGDLLRKKGNEFGSTTGRPRRCGWIDLVALKYACMLNGVTDLIITKADVLDEMPQIGLCTSYQIDGNTTTQFPFDIHHTETIPQYDYVTQWEKNLSDCVADGDLPENFNTFIKHIESFTGVKISFISNGVGRNQLIVRK